MVNMKQWYGQFKNPLFRGAVIHAFQPTFGYTKI